VWLPRVIEFAGVFDFFVDFEFAGVIDFFVVFDVGMVLGPIDVDDTSF
jgi:hypothetical protein